MVHFTCQDCLSRTDMDASERVFNVEFLGFYIVHLYAFIAFFHLFIIVVIL